MKNRLFYITAKIGKKTKKFEKPITFLEALLTMAKHPNISITMKEAVI